MIRYLYARSLHSKRQNPTAPLPRRTSSVVSSRRPSTVPLGRAVIDRSPPKGRKNDHWLERSRIELDGIRWDYWIELDGKRWVLLELLQTRVADGLDFGTCGPMT